MEIFLRDNMPHSRVGELWPREGLGGGAERGTGQKLRTQSQVPVDVLCLLQIVRFLAQSDTVVTNMLARASADPDPHPGFEEQVTS